MKTSIAALALAITFTAANAEDKKANVEMPAVAVLILCKSEPDGPPDQNAEWTHVRKRKWVYENSMMVCKRELAKLTWLPPQGLNLKSCQRAAIMQMAQWEIEHPDSDYQPWRVACPTPVMDTTTGRIIDWVMPGCGHRDTVKCENDDMPI